MADNTQVQVPPKRQTRSGKEYNPIQVAPKAKAPGGSDIRPRHGRKGYCFTGKRLGDRVNKSWGEATKQNKRSQGMVRPYNTCYRRATLQCLLHVPKFVNFLNLNHQDCHHEGCGEKENGCGEAARAEACVLCKLIEVSRSYWGADEQDGAHARPMEELDDAVRPYLMEHGLQRMANPLSQEDAQEFMEALIAAMKGAVHQAPQPASVATSLDGMFLPGLRDDVHHPSCGHRHSEDNDMPVLRIPVYAKEIRDGTELEELIADRWDRLGDDECRHAACQDQHLPASQPELRTVITRAPEVLTINLMRIEQSSRGGRSNVSVLKTRKRIVYPEILDLTEHLEEPVLKKTKKGKKARKTRLQYRLDAVASHEGESALAGHWTCVVREPNGMITALNDTKTFTPADAKKGNWEKMANDMFLNPVRSAKANNGDATVLFYSKI